MKRFFAIFVLTPREQRLVIFVVLALVIGVSIKYHRDMSVNNAPTTGPESSPAPLVSPTPSEQ